MLLCTQSTRVVKDICHYIAHKDSPGEAPDSVCQYVRDYVDNVLISYPSVIQTCQRLQFNGVGDITKLMDLMKSMFSDDNVCWGRIIALLIFGGMKSKQCEERRDGRSKEAITNCIIYFLVTHLGGWIVSNGGWDNVCNHIKIERQVNNFVLYVLYVCMYLY